MGNETHITHDNLYLSVCYLIQRIGHETLMTVTAMRYVKFCIRWLLVNRRFQYRSKVEWYYTGWGIKISHFSKRYKNMKEAI